MKKYIFPNPATLPKEASFCIGGDLEPSTIITAYKSGYFPWFMPGDPIIWHCPQTRAVFLPDEIKLHKSTKPFLKKYDVKFDNDFENLINLCYKSRNKNETWLSDKMVNAYISLANLDIAHSVEVYYESELIGGLYGLIFGRVFCGESMVSLKKEASKVALINLGKNLSKFDFLIDAQVMNPHLKFMGAREISQNKFLEIYYELISKPSNIDFKNLKPIL
ncbi:leucyl/phenylalanyl-tRNA--protein transferase [Campylobacter ureolyticus]|uniref:leucyl/phenylalanyl-tRNA--protein transferase n=1 Tax=Campylobacter ureolyticus TaxID=827 RepID=UPI0022B3DB91|nr:leucyl/phenylalanyl-tRNA--protein transferase [Campylobacter ureolyticus]MCZ6174201.1 leucyl/phenylalanyl-tRNA--protein transferase [Campylobacter ureolyticus]